MLKRIDRVQLIIKLLVFFFAVIMALDPISVKLQSLVDPILLKEAGYNPFQFWLLINSVNWGNTIYNTFFWIIPAVIAEVFYYEEYKTVIYRLKIISSSRKMYCIRKALSMFFYTFICSFILLALNIAITYIVFNWNTEQTEYYLRLIPRVGTFSYQFYHISHLIYAIFYAFLNAVTIALFSLFCLGFNMIIQFRNKYLSIIIPSATLYGITFLFDSTDLIYRYNIRAIIQPRATSALSIIITTNDVIYCFLGWIIAISIMVGIGYFKNQDILS